MVTASSKTIITVLSSDSLTAARPALRCPLRCLSARLRSHIWAPRPAHGGNPHLRQVSARHTHGRALHGNHAYQMWAVPNRTFHRVLELPAQVSVLQQRLRWQPGGGEGVHSDSQQGVPVCGRLLRGRRLLYQTQRVRARERCCDKRYLTGERKFLLLASLFSYLLDFFYYYLNFSFHQSGNILQE